MKKSTLLCISLFSLSASIIYSSDKSGKYSNSDSALERGLASIKSSSYRRYNGGFQSFTNAKLERDAADAQRKNNRNLQQPVVTPKSSTPIVGSAAWVALKNK